MELENFIEAIQKDTQPQITGEHGLKALKICEAALESAKKEKTIILETKKNKN